MGTSFCASRDAPLAGAATTAGCRDLLPPDFPLAACPTCAPR